MTSRLVLRDDVRPHTSASTRALQEHFNWELFDRPLYSSDLSSRNYYLFTYVKTGWNHNESTKIRS
jgi:hypothetical protein